MARDVFSLSFCFILSLDNKLYQKFLIDPKDIFESGSSIFFPVVHIKSNILVTTSKLLFLRIHVLNGKSGLKGW